MITATHGSTTVRTLETAKGVLTLTIIGPNIHNMVRNPLHIQNHTTLTQSAVMIKYRKVELLGKWVKNTLASGGRHRGVLGHALLKISILGIWHLSVKLEPLSPKMASFY